MPQDQIVEEESVEQESLAFAADEEKAFGAEADGAPAPAAADPPAGQKPEGQDPIVVQATTEPKAEAKPAAQPDDEKSESQKWLDQRAGQLEASQPPPSVPPPTEASRQAAPGQAQPPQAAQPHQKPADWLDSEVVVGDQKITIRDAIEADPMTFKVAEAIAENLVAQKLAGAGYVTNDQAAQLAAQIQELQFWGQVGLRHPDYAKFVGDKADPGFIEWLNKQPDPYQRIARQCATPQDAIAMIDLYKDSVQATRAADIDGRRRETKKKTDALLSGHSGGGSRGKDTGAKTAADEEAAFYAEATR